MVKEYCVSEHLIQTPENKTKLRGFISILRKALTLPVSDSYPCSGYVFVLAAGTVFIYNKRNVLNRQHLKILCENKLQQ